MIGLLTLAMLPVLLAQDQGKAETCSYLAGKISKLDDAITLSLCDLTGLDFANLVIPTVCQTVSMTAIPPCMVKVGKAAQDQCLVEATKLISQEYNAPEEEMTIVEQCKCNAFGKSRYNLAKVQEMLDCSSSSARKRRGAPTEPQAVYPQAQHQQAYYQPQQAYYQPQQAFGADTLWFQYSLCQDKDFLCYFFSNHWSQGDFGQYYLYDNLLSAEDGLFGGDNSLLPILALGGGGGGMNTILPLLLLNRKSRGADCEAGSMENSNGDCVTCPVGTTLNADEDECVNAKKRRSTCPIGHVNCVCPVGTKLNADEDECVNARKRRSTCPIGHVNCVCPVGTKLNGAENECVAGSGRKRREDVEDIKDCDPETERCGKAYVCDPDVEDCPPSERRRRNADKPCSGVHDCDEGHACIWACDAGGYDCLWANAHKLGVCREM